MQAIFIFGLMGVFFYLITSITVGLFQNSTQIKQQRIARTGEIFKQIEFALNDGLLQQSPSLDGVDLTNFQFARPFVDATPTELDMDPWATPYEIVSFNEDVILLADNSGTMGPSAVIANVMTFGIMSAGPDRIMDTPRPGNLTELRFMAPQGDDIVHVFSNYDALNRIWNRAYEVDNTIEDVATKSYTEKLRDFVTSADTISFNGRNMPSADVLIEYSMCLADFNAGTGNYNGNVRRADGSNIDCAGGYSASVVASCGTFSGGNLVIGPETASCWMKDPKLFNVEGYPHMAGDTNIAALPQVSSLAPSAIGVESEVRRDPFGGNVVLEYDTTIPYRLVIRRQYADGGWNINYYREVTVVDPTAL